MLQRLADALVDLAPRRYRLAAKQFVKFGITGTIGAIVDFSTYNFITRALGFTAFYTVFNVDVIVANNISVFLAIVSNFIFNKYWTFRDKSGQVARQWAGFFAFNTFTWLLNQLLVGFFISHVVFFDVFFGTQEDNAAKVVAIGVILFLNFLGSKFLIFNRQKSATTQIRSSSWY